MISIVIPAFNAEKTIGRSIESVLRQSIPVQEIIVVDDGSTDCTGRICDGYASRCPSIKVIHTQNQGVSAARNIGIEKAKGKYLGFVDSDDWIAPQMYETLFNTMMATNADMAACGVIQVSASGQYPESNDGIVEEIQGQELYKTILDPNGIRGYLWNKLYNAELITNRLNENVLQCEDLLFVAQNMCNITKAVYIHTPLYYYVRSEKKGNDFTKRSLSLISAYEQLLEVYRNHAHDYVPEIEMYILRACVNYRAMAKMNESDSQMIQMFYDGIQSHWKSVFLSDHVSIKDKMNIILTYLFPKMLIRAKEKVHATNHLRGKWEP